MNRKCMSLCIGFAFSQPVLAAAPGPADASAPAPALAYDSVFKGYRGYREEPLADWRAANEAVARGGGHAGVIRGSPAPSGSKDASATGNPATRGAGQAPRGAHAH